MDWTGGEGRRRYEFDDAVAKKIVNKRKDEDVLEDLGGAFPVGEFDIFDNTPEDIGDSHEPNGDIHGDTMYDADDCKEGLDRYINAEVCFLVVATL